MQIYTSSYVLIMYNPDKPIRILNIPVFSVPSESLFSEAGDQVTKKQNRLDPERVNKMIVDEEFYS